MAQDSGFNIDGSKTRAKLGGIISLGAMGLALAGSLCIAAAVGLGLGIVLSIPSCNNNMHNKDRAADKMG